MVPFIWKGYSHEHEVKASFGNRMGEANKKY